jgi:hypothetical protein
MMRFIYLVYYLKKIDVNLYLSFVTFASQDTGRSKLALMLDSFYSVFRFNISLLEYFQFKFYKQNALERSEWAGTGFMFEFQKRMNPPKSRDILDDKIKFHKAYSGLIQHRAASVLDLENGQVKLKDLIHSDGDLLVVKEVSGKCGKGVDFISASQFNSELDLSIWMKKEGFDLAEVFIKQHPLLNELSSTAVNTVRIFTQLNNYNEVDILGCRLRISVNSKVDNLAAGNLAAEIDEISGKVRGSAIYSDIRKSPCMFHPLTGIRIHGFQIPFWQESIDLVKNAALLHPQNRSIGWDIAITNQGPALIEGNHDWCKLLWQLPVGKGLKSELLKYIN